MQPSTRGRNQFQSRHQSLHITMPPKKRSTPSKRSSKKTADDASRDAKQPKMQQRYNKKGEAKYINPTPWAIEGRRAAELAMGKEPTPLQPFLNPRYVSDSESEDEHATAPPEAKDTFVPMVHRRRDPRVPAVDIGPPHPGHLATPRPCPPRLAPHRAGFHEFIAYKMQNIPEHLWQQFEGDCLQMLNRYSEQGRQPQPQQPHEQQQQQHQQPDLRMSPPAASGVYGQPPSQDPSFQ